MMRLTLRGVMRGAVALLKGDVKNPGSRGGHIVGHTKGGKPIYQRHDSSDLGRAISAVAADHPDFTHADHRDASDFHLRASRFPSNTPAESMAHADHMVAHDAAAKEKDPNGAAAKMRAASDKFAATKAGAGEQPWGYFNGDKIQFNGKKQTRHGGEFHEFTYLEGHKKRQGGLTQHGPGSPMNPWPRTEHAPAADPVKPKAAKATQLGLFKSIRLVLKGGEGSRGGHIVGHTRGGHPIYGGPGLGGIDGHKPMPSLHKQLASNYRKMHPAEHAREAANHAEMADDRARRGDHDAALHQAVLADWHGQQARQKSAGHFGGEHKPLLWNDDQIHQHAKWKREAAERDDAERRAALERGDGPHLVGRTSSGKGVYRTLDRERLTRGGTGEQAQHSWQNLHQHFSPDEHAEAGEMHRQLAEKHRDDPTLHSYHRMHATAHHEARAEQHERIANDAKGRAAGGSPLARQVQLFHEKAAEHARAVAGPPQLSMLKSARLALTGNRSVVRLVLKAAAPAPLKPAPSPGAHELGKTRSGKPVFASGAEAAGYNAADHQDAARFHYDAHEYHDDQADEHDDTAGKDPDWRRGESHQADAQRHRKLADHHETLARDHLVAGGRGGSVPLTIGQGKITAGAAEPPDRDDRQEVKQRFAKRTHRDYPGGATDYDRTQYRRKAA